MENLHSSILVLEHEMKEKIVSLSLDSKGSQEKLQKQLQQALQLLQDRFDGQAAKTKVRRETQDNACQALEDIVRVLSENVIDLRNGKGQYRSAGKIREKWHSCTKVLREMQELNGQD